MNEFELPQPGDGVPLVALPVLDDTIAHAVRRVLLQLAHLQDEDAARVAARTPYWEPCPGSVTGCRAAAEALRAAADALQRTPPTPLRSAVS